MTAEKQMTAKELAQHIAHDLFHSGGGAHGDHLRLFAKDQYLGGWGEQALADRIEMLLTSKGFNTQ